MPKFKNIQSRFTQGEFDPLMIGRTDVDQYYGGAALLRNVFTLPQGGIKRRHGLEYIDRVLGVITKTNPSSVTAPNGGTTSNASDDNTGTVFTTVTAIGTTNPYVVVQYDMGSSVSIGLVRIKDLKTSSGAATDFYVQVSTNGATWVSCGDVLTLSATGKDYTRRVHGSYRYIRLARIGSTNLAGITISLDDMLVFTEAGTSETKIIQFEFNVSQTYIFVFSDKNIAIYQNGSYLIDYYAPSYTTSIIPDIDWTQSADTLIIFSPDVQTASLARQGANDIWSLSNITFSNIPTYDFGSGSESVWSVTRGWPRHGAFYQGRLYLDGGKSRPTVCYGSKVNSVYDFNFGTALDNEAVGPVGSNEMNEITGIFAGRNLTIFTAGAEHVFLQTLGEPITPTNVVLQTTTNIGSEPGFRQKGLENGVFYIQRGGKSIQEFIYTDTQANYTNNVVSLLSSHLVESPVDFDIRRATSTEDGAYILLVIGDGTLTMANVLRGQEITAFVNQSTDGLFKNCASDVDDMYFVIERTINGTSVRYLERFNDQCYTDCAYIADVLSPTSTFTGLSHLEAKECNVRADEYVMSNQTVSSGSITIELDAESLIEIGIPFTPMIKDLPVENPQIGGILGRLVNISEISLRVDQTAELIVNGIRKTFLTFGPSGLGSPLDVPASNYLYTGVFRMVGFRGWDNTGQVTITQSIPVPMTILSIAKRVNT